MLALLADLTAKLTVQDQHVSIIFIQVYIRICVCLSVCMYVPLFAGSLRTQQLKQVQLVTLLKPLHNNGTVRHC
jgi:hypothetical protein